MPSIKKNYVSFVTTEYLQTVITFTQRTDVLISSSSPLISPRSRDPAWARAARAARGGRARATQTAAACSRGGGTCPAERPARKGRRPRAGYAAWSSRKWWVDQSPPGERTRIRNAPSAAPDVPTACAERARRRRDASGCERGVSPPAWAAAVSTPAATTPPAPWGSSSGRTDGEVSSIRQYLQLMINAKRHWRSTRPWTRM